MWAAEKRTYVFKWKCRTRNFVNRPPPDKMQEITNKSPFFWQYWVLGADGYLNTNINGNLALVNGAPITMHSLTFENEEYLQELIHKIQQQNLPFGSEIEIETPSAVNVIVQESLDDKPLTRKRKQQLQLLRDISRSYGIDPRSRAIILPLTAAMAASNDFESFTFPTGDTFLPVAEVKVKAPFPFDLAFAMTVHKSQGRTILRVVLDLTEHPFRVCRMVYAAIIVALSLVQNGDHDIRLLQRELLFMSTFLNCSISSWVFLFL